MAIMLAQFSHRLALHSLGNEAEDFSHGKSGPRAIALDTLVATCPWWIDGRIPRGCGRRLPSEQALDCDEAHSHTKRILITDRPGRR
jgi:hypothetical protein